MAVRITKPQKSAVTTNSRKADKSEGTLITRNEAQMRGLQATVIGYVQNLYTQRQKWLERLADADNSRDLNAECKYPDTVDVQTVKKLTARVGPAQRVNNLLPEECWQHDPEVYEQEDPDETPFEQAWKELNTRMNLCAMMERLDKLAGLGRFGVMLLGVADGKDLDKPLKGVPETGVDLDFKKRGARPATPRTPAPPETRAQTLVDGGPIPEPDTAMDPADEPLPEEGDAEEEAVVEDLLTPEQRQALKKLLFIRVFDESYVSVDTYVTDTKSPRFGQPEFYSMTLGDVQDGTIQAKQAKVHWSRVIHFADNRESSEVFGIPRIQRTFNTLLDLQKVASSDAEGYWKSGFPGLSIESQPGVENPEFDEEEAREEIDRYQNSLQRYLTLLGMTAKTLAPNVSDPTPHFMIQMQCLAISEGCPLRIFLGSEEAKLAASQDKRTWNGRVSRRQQKVCVPYIVRELVDRLLAAEILPMPEQYEAVFPDLNTPSKDDKADWIAKVTAALVAYIQGGVDTVIPPEEFLTMIIGFEKDEVDAMLDAAEARIKDIANENDLPGREPVTESSLQQQQMDAQAAQVAMENDTKKTDAALLKASQKPAKPK